MLDVEKSREQLIAELNDARRKLREFEALRASIEGLKRQRRPLRKSLSLNIAKPTPSGEHFGFKAAGDAVSETSRDGSFLRNAHDASRAMGSADDPPIPSVGHACADSLSENIQTRNRETKDLNSPDGMFRVAAKESPACSEHCDLFVTQGDTTMCKRLEGKLLRNIKVLEAISRIFQGAIACANVEELGRAIMAIVEEMTGSKLGLICEMGPDGLLHETVVSVSARSACTMTDNDGMHSLARNIRAQGLFRSVLQKGRSLLTNDPSNHPDSGAVPHGHLPLKAFLGVPLVSDGHVAGIVAVANREGGYSIGQQEDLESLAPSIVEVLERKRVEVELKESEERFRAFMDNSPAWSWIKDSEHRYVFGSKASEKKLGVPVSAIVGRTDRELWSAETADAFEQSDAVALEGRASIELVESCLGTDGRNISLNTLKFPLVNSTGERFIGGISLDITRQLELARNMDEMNSQLNLALDAAKAGIWEWDLATNANVWSKQLFDLYGLDKDEFSPHFDSWLECVAPDQREEISEYLRNTVHKGGLIEMEWRVNLPKGRKRWLFSRGMPIFGRHGGLEGYRGVVIDITERVLAERARKELDAKFRAALESMSDAVFISDVDGRFVHFNEAFATFHKFKGKNECFKTLGKYPAILEVFMETGGGVPLEMWPVSRALRGESVMNAEYGLRRRDTGEAWVGSYNFAPIRDAEGGIAGSVVVARDITKSKKAERLLRESEEKFRKLFRSMPAATVIATLNEGKLIDANDAFEKIMGYSRSEVLGRSLIELGIWASAGDRLNYISKLKQHRAVDNFEATLHIRDGRPITVLISGEVIDISGEMWNISAWLDISLRKRLENDLIKNTAQLEDMNAALRVLLQQREQDRPELERSVLENMRLIVAPHLLAIRGENPSPQVLRNLDLALSAFDNITSGFARSLHDEYKALTGSEIRIADMIRSGMTSKEIASALGLSVTTANFHRASIRKKLGLVGKKEKLNAMLMKLPEGISKT